MKRILVFAALASTLALIAAACGGGGGAESTQKKASGGTTTLAGETANLHGIQDVSGENEIKVEMDDFYFSPTVLKGTPGQTVTLELENEGKVEHNLTIDAQQIDKDVEGGKSATVKVTIPNSGTVAFYCKYHRSQGMAGALETTSGESTGGMTGETSTQTSTGSGY